MSKYEIEEITTPQNNTPEEKKINLEPEVLPVIENRPEPECEIEKNIEPSMESDLSEYSPAQETCVRHKLFGNISNRNITPTRAPTTNYGPYLLGAALFATLGSTLF